MIKHIDFRDQITKNKRKSFFLMISISLILILLGYAISQAFSPAYFFTIMIFSIIFSLSYILISYYKSDKIAVLAAGAKEAKKEEFRDYYRLVESLIISSNLPMPKLYIMKSSQINAFASGRNPENSIVCVTTGALEKLDRRELEGVLAHELSHIANYDIRYMTLVSIMVGMIAIISEIFLRSFWLNNSRSKNDSSGAIFILIGILLAILAPILVKIVQLSISRKREYTADATAVKFTRNPNGLIGALQKIKTDSPNQKNKKVSKAISPLFFSNPLKNTFSTHPELDDRIKILKNM